MIERQIEKCFLYYKLYWTGEFIPCLIEFNHHLCLHAKLTIYLFLFNRLVVVLFMIRKIFANICIIISSIIMPSNCTVTPQVNSTTQPVVAVCGNGQVESNEQCDDGNTISGDGCSSRCNLEPVANSTAGSQVPGAGHNQGMNCITCHNGIYRQSHWTIAGTVYTNAAGTNPNPGVSVSITNATTGAVIGTIVSDLNGNFYSNDPKYAGGQAHATVSGATSSGLSMSTTVIQLDRTNTTAGGGGSCNQTGCHTTAALGTIY